MHYTEPDSLITALVHIISIIKTVKPGLIGRGLRKLLLVAGFWFLVAELSVYEQVASDFQTDKSLKCAVSINLKMYNEGVWIRAVVFSVATGNVISIQSCHTATLTVTRAIDQIIKENFHSEWNYLMNSTNRQFILLQILTQNKEV